MLDRATEEHVAGTFNISEELLPLKLVMENVNNVYFVQIEDNNNILKTAGGKDEPFLTRNIRVTGNRVLR